MYLSIPAAIGLARLPCRAAGLLGCSPPVMTVSEGAVTRAGCFDPMSIEPVSRMRRLPVLTKRRSSVGPAVLFIVTRGPVDRTRGPFVITSVLFRMTHGPFGASRVIRRTTAGYSGTRPLLPLGGFVKIAGRARMRKTARATIGSRHLDRQDGHAGSYGPGVIFVATRVAFRGPALPTNGPGGVRRPRSVRSANGQARPRSPRNAALRPLSSMRSVHDGMADLFGKTPRLSAAPPLPAPPPPIEPARPPAHVRVCGALGRTGPDRVSSDAACGRLRARRPR
jgi:hypothetical protein